jgi:hypothetical protein
MDRVSMTARPNDDPPRPEDARPDRKVPSIPVGSRPSITRVETPISKVSISLGPADAIVHFDWLMRISTLFRRTTRQ